MNTFRILFQYKNNSNQIVTNNTDIGLITSLDNSYNVTKTNIGIPTQPSQNAFAMDSGVTRTYRFSFKRVCPDNDPSTDDVLDGDSTRWSNGFWIYVMKRFIVNRWQTETDGCKIRYEGTIARVDGDGTKHYMYPPIDPTNAYVSEFRPSQTAGDNMTITGTIAFTVGATNTSKTVAKHTIIYDANYKSYSVSASDDETNYVMVTDLAIANAIAIPTNWKSRASTEYGITVDNDRLKWCTDAIPNASSTYYDAGAQIILENDSATPPMNIETITLYAIYDADDPPTE